MNITGVFSAMRTIGIVLLIVAVVWFFKDWQHQREDNARLSENAHQQHLQDSTRFSQQTLTESEMKEYVHYKNPELEKLLRENNIRLNRVESITSSSLQYKNDSTRVFGMGKVLAAIEKRIPNSQPFVDRDSCMTIRGNLKYENDSLKLEITGREFKNKSDGVAYWQRRQWNFLGIKTRLFGKKEFTAKVFDQCGESKTLRIEKKQ